MPAPPDLAALKDRVVTTIRVLIHEGLIDAFGHASLRIPGTDPLGKSLALGRVAVDDKDPTDGIAKARNVPEQAIPIGMCAESIEH